MRDPRKMFMPCVQDDALSPRWKKEARPERASQATKPWTYLACCQIAAL